MKTFILSLLLTMAVTGCRRDAAPQEVPQASVDGYAYVGALVADSPGKGWVEGAVREKALLPSQYRPVAFKHGPNECTIEARHVLEPPDVTPRLAAEQTRTQLLSHVLMQDEDQRDACTQLGGADDVVDLSCVLHFGEPSRRSFQSYAFLRFEGLRGVVMIESICNTARGADTLFAAHATVVRSLQVPGREYSGQLRADCPKDTVRQEQSPMAMWAGQLASVICFDQRFDVTAEVWHVPPSQRRAESEGVLAEQLLAERLARINAMTDDVVGECAIEPGNEHPQFICRYASSDPDDAGYDVRMTVVRLPAVAGYAVVHTSTPSGANAYGLATHKALLASLLQP